MEATPLGDQLRKYRQEANYSVRQLARLAEVDPTWLSKVERGIYRSPDPRRLYRLAQALNIETADLYLEAGYGDPRGLPGLAPYLRAKYDLPPEAIAQLQAHFELFEAKYKDDGRRAT